MHCIEEVEQIQHTGYESRPIVRHKNVAAQPAIEATISAPTSLAIRIAEQAGVRLLSFCRADGYVDYTGAAPGMAAGVAC